ncbi:MAG: TIGR04133 family radical SAM/SPASM protein [Bacteroidales bacterium]|nr:TIGR04133 family radical SAM/SPASM protein [Bacteroidales bacterium]
MTASPGILQRIALQVNHNYVRELAASHPLTQLFWECTLRCNMRCRHCGSDCKVSSLHPDMPFEDFEKVLLQIKEKYNPRKILIILSGGEPLMRDDLAACGRRIRKLGFPWGLVSNGRLMSDAKIDELLRAGMRSATISLDGLEEDHNWMRGMPDSFSYASAAIRRLSGAGIPFDVVTCVNRRNFPKLNELKEYLISLGLKRWRLFTVFPVGRAATDPELQLTADEYRRMMDFIVSTRKEKRIHVSYGCEGFLGSYEGKVRDHLFSCQAGLTIGSVRIDGAISGCTSIRSHYDQGNIYRDDFIDVWENRFEDFRNHEKFRTEACAECKFWKWCEGNGMHLRDDQGRLIMCNLQRLQ